MNADHQRAAFSAMILQDAAALNQANNASAEAEALMAVVEALGAEGTSTVLPAASR